MIRGWSPGGQVRQGEHTLLVVWSRRAVRRQERRGRRTAACHGSAQPVDQQLVLVDVTVRCERADELAVALHLYGHRPH